jgi:hypothetical protein
MGLTYAFNELLSCILTGLSVAIFLALFAKFGWLPMFYLTTEEPPQEENQGE